MFENSRDSVLYERKREGADFANASSLRQYFPFYKRSSWVSAGLIEMVETSDTHFYKKWSSF